MTLQLVVVSLFHVLIFPVKGEAVIQSGVYNLKSTLAQPILSLCNSDSVRVKSDGSIDLCLTINPAIEGKKIKTYTCESLRVSHVGGAQFTVGEANDPCILKMRAYANSVGISVATPIKFTYWYGADPSGKYHSMGTISIHVKWAQQSTPFKANQFEYSSAQSSTVITVGGLLLLLLALF